ncbi:MAG: DNA repair protein RecO [Deltaproteobacteria bacterium]|nr:DNA repair protein RecO [Deltaproteobacteria bacterium]
MAAEEFTPAVVLRTRDYAEADRVVTLLTRNFGKLSGIAKGAKASRRRFERKLEPFTQAMLFFRRRPQGQLVFITRAERIDGAPGELRDLAKIALGSYMLELTDALTTEEAEAVAAYEVLTSALAVLDQSTPNTGLRQAFELEMLQAAGFGLDFGCCRLCGKVVEPEHGFVYFVPSRGGTVCALCRRQSIESAARMAGANAAALARLAQTPLAESTTLPDGGTDGSSAIARFLSTILDRKLRSVDFLNSTL